jgi:uncharacterized membrane protein YagU involved in acid resistance
MQNDTLQKAAVGAVAGLIGTVTMSASMAIMQRLLPRRHQEPYEPRQVVEGMLKKTKLHDEVDEPAKSALTYAAHLGFGAAMGAAYEVIERRLPVPPGAKGPAWGLFVWAASYSGWLPTLEILPPAHRRPAARNALMAIAHIVWGATTECVAGMAEEARVRRTRQRARMKRARLRRNPGQGRPRLPGPDFANGVARATL